MKNNQWEQSFWYRFIFWKRIVFSGVCKVGVNGTIYFIGLVNGNRCFFCCALAKFEKICVERCYEYIEIKKYKTD